MPPPESDEEEVKERKGLQILSPNTLTRLPILLAQIKAGKLKYEISQILYFFVLVL